MGPVLGCVLGCVLRRVVVMERRLRLRGIWTELVHDRERCDEVVGWRAICGYEEAQTPKNEASLAFSITACDTAEKMWTTRFYLECRTK